MDNSTGLLAAGGGAILRKCAVRSTTPSALTATFFTCEGCFFIDDSPFFADGSVRGGLLLSDSCRS